MDDIWDYIDKHLKAGDMVSTGSFFGKGSDKDTNDIGVPYRHAFTVNGAVELSDGTKLIRIRNPWGSELFHGDWSDSSTKWTEKLKEDAGLKAVDLSKTTLRDPLFNQERAKVVQDIMAQRMKELPSEEFQDLLRPCFQEDEIKLIIIGGILGAMAGLAQLAYIFGQSL